jgi:hypothetical protein
MSSIKTTSLIQLPKWNGSVTLAQAHVLQVQIFLLGAKDERKSDLPPKVHPTIPRPGDSRRDYIMIVGEG